MINPLLQLKARWQKAVQEGEPGGAYCSLATITDNGYPSVRVLTLRDFNDTGILLLTNSTGPKWQELQNNHVFEIHLFWPQSMIQYKLTGNQFLQLDEKTMAGHWQKKHPEAKYLDLFYSRIQSQSTVLTSRAYFLEQLAMLRTEYPDSRDIPYPDHALGLWFYIHRVEEWLGSPVDRQHQRYRYELGENGWQKQALVP